MPIGRTLGETGCSVVWKETVSVICGQGLIGCPGDQALRSITGKFKIKKDMYMDRFEGLIPLSGMFFS